MEDAIKHKVLTYEEKKMAERVMSFLLEREGEHFQIEQEYPITIKEQRVYLDLYLPAGIPSLNHFKESPGC